MSSISAAREVADRIAAAGDIPSSAIRTNSGAMGSLQGKPPTSVPKTMRTPALSALWNEGPCSATRLRSRWPAGVSSGAQSR